MSTFHKIIIIFSFVGMSNNLYCMQLPEGTDQKDFKILVTSLNSYNVPNYLRSKSVEELELIRLLATNALREKIIIQALAQSVKIIPAEYKNNPNPMPLMLKELSIKVNQRIALLSKSKLKKVVAPILKAAPKKIAPLQPKVLNAVERKEEKIDANQLYIGLDIKTHNTSGQLIDFEEPIETMYIILDEDHFIPTDYFHITIAWYSEKETLSPQIIAKVEHALAKASEILKIVFPEGVTGVSLLDGGVILGNYKTSTIAFRVAPSENLKKLQDIILKFLSFEKIEGFRYNTFDKETPIHMSLGKIKNVANKNEVEDLVGQLAAPEGARASRGQNFTISTYRLTHSIAGQAWQEKMSYKF